MAEQPVPPGDGPPKIYTVELDDAAEKDFARLSEKAKRQVAKLTDSLALDPRAGNVRELI